MKPKKMKVEDMEVGNLYFITAAKDTATHAEPVIGIPTGDDYVTSVSAFMGVGHGKMTKEMWVLAYEIKSSDIIEALKRYTGASK